MRKDPELDRFHHIVREKRAIIFFREKVVSSRATRLVFYFPVLPLRSKQIHQEIRAESERGRTAVRSGELLESLAPTLLTTLVLTNKSGIPFPFKTCKR